MNILISVLLILIHLDVNLDSSHDGGSGVIGSKKNLNIVDVSEIWWNEDYPLDTIISEYKMNRKGKEQCNRMALF